MSKKRIVIGFDGFLDMLAKPIAEKRDEGNLYFETIESFGTYLCGQAGKSCSVEMDVLARKVGGNAPLLSIAAESLSMDVCCVGMLGVPTLNPLFAALPFELYSYLSPGESTALEFDDGKVFLAPGIPALEDPWAMVDAAMDKRAGDIFAQADVIALVNWSELSFSHILWEKTLDALWLQPTNKDKYALFDLCDCSRKPPKEITAVLSLIGRFSERRHTILSLNENECLDIGAKLFDQSDCGAIAKKLHEAYGIDEVLVHAHEWSLAVNDVEQCVQSTSFVKKPVISTGAGDHFNAAYAYGAATGIAISERLDFCHRFVNSYITSGKSGFEPNQ